MKLVVDMCLPPALAAGLIAAGHESQHWSAVGDPRADDTEIMDWVLEHGHVILTHDMDFNALLFGT